MSFQTASYGYDNQGKVLDIYYPDSTHDWKTYDVMGGLKTTVDAISTNTYFYDNLNRLTTVTNATGVIRSTEYDPDNRVTASTDANGVQIQSTYDNLGRIRTRTAPDSGVEAYGYTANVTGPSSFTNQISKVWQYAYDAAGRKTNEIGVGVFTNRFTYDAGGNLKTLADGKSQTTTWKYDLYGRLTNKLDQASASILTYQYDANSRLTNRSSSAFGSTKYGYDDRGSLTNVAYPSGTPSVTNCFDALGRLTNMVDGMGPTKYAYYPGGLLWTEDSPWASDVMTNRYHSSVRGLRVGFDLQQPTGLWSQTNAYDAGKRLTVITAKSGIFNYSYRGAGNLWTNLALPNTAVITNSFETVGRLVGTTLRQSGGTVTNRHTYTYNVAGQRTVMARTDASTVTYSYDNIGEVSKALGSGGVSTENLGYGYDAAFNLSKKTNGSVATFSVDSRNQLTSDGTYPYAYDANGNLTNKNTGYWVYSYDAENRLVSVQNASYYKTTFQYDGKSRLRKRVEWSGWNGSYFASTNAVNYLYDGMRVIQERDDSNTPLVSYTRGLDLSGSIEGAGGIAGLLSRSHSYSAGSWGTHSFYHADGGGNVTMMLNSSQSAVAIYKYDPYGNTLTSSGTLASANTYRFSSKEIHANSGMYYYGYRFYDPAPQRWLNRDPLGEVGFELARGGLQSVLGDGPNIFIYTRNNPIAGIDPYGLKYGNPVTGPGGRTYPGFPWDPPSPPCPGSPDPCAAKCALAASLGAASLAACVGPQTPFLCMAAVSAYYLASEACVTCLKANKSI